MHALPPNPSEQCSPVVRLAAGSALAAARALACGRAALQAEFSAAQVGAGAGAGRARQLQPRRLLLLGTRAVRLQRLSHSGRSGQQLPLQALPPPKRARLAWRLPASQRLIQALHRIRQLRICGIRAAWTAAARRCAGL